MYKKLLAIQTELKAPKAQYNKFGQYNYRSCEDILEAVKPLCVRHECVLTLTDEIVEVGGRVYVKATAHLTSVNGGNTQVTAFAREEETKKGMDASQITGSASSYARKYALNGLFCIDDTRDADATNKHDQPEKEKGDMDRVKKQIATCNNLNGINTLAESASRMEWTKEERAELKQMFETKRQELNV